jgi:superfamily I DNA and/or RNA helicase
MNVALTRARKLLVVVGDSSTIGNDLFYKKFIDYTQENGFYHSAYEYMDF